ncbi:MAG: hypothetical protein ABF899_01720 [Oenococcus sp.]
MIIQTDQAKTAWQATERTLDAIVNINGIDYHTTDIASISYDSGAFTGDTFAIGSTYENNVTITFIHLVEGLKQGQTVTAKIGIKLPGGTFEYSPLGAFVISDDIEMDRNNDATTIKAYDRMALLEGNYASKLTYPAKVVDVIAEIANLSGVPLNIDDIARLPVLTDVPKAITGQTYRNAIGWIAQFFAGFALFDRDGKLTIRQVTDVDYTLDPSQYEQGGLTKNEAPYVIGGIQCQVTTTTTDSTGDSTDNTVTLQAGSSSGSQIAITNDLMDQNRLNQIWDSIKDLNFYPFSLNWFGNPAIEAGDWLALKDTQGNSFNVPNNAYTMTFDGSLSSVSSAEQTSTSQDVYSYTGNLQQKVDSLFGLRSPTGNFIYGPDTITEPTDAKFGDIWYKQNGNDVELWIYQKQSDGTGKWVLDVYQAFSQKITDQVDTAVSDAKSYTDDLNDSLTPQIATIGSQADSAFDKASQAISSYAQVANQASSAYATASSAASDVASDVAGFHATFNNYSSAADSQFTSMQAGISANASDIALSAKQADLDATNNHLQTAEADIQTNANAITQMVTNSDYNTLTGQLQSQINQVTDTANSHTQTISQLQTQVNSLGQINLVQNSEFNPDLGGWTVNAAYSASPSFVSSYSVANIGSNAISLQNSSTIAPDAEGSRITSAFIPVASGNIYSYSYMFSVEQLGSSNTLATARVDVIYYDANHNQIALGPYQGYSAVMNFTQYSFNNQVVPTTSGIAYMAVSVYIRGANAKVHFGRLMVTNNATIGKYVAGAYSGQTVAQQGAFSQVHDDLYKLSGFVTDGNGNMGAGLLTALEATTLMQGLDGSQSIMQQTSTAWTVALNKLAISNRNFALATSGTQSFSGNATYDHLYNLSANLSGKTVTVAFDVASSTSGIPVTIATHGTWHQLAKFTTNGASQHVVAILTYASGDRIIYAQATSAVDLQFSNFIISNSSNEVAWSAAPEDLATNSNLLPEINIQAGTTLIQNNKLYLNANSIVFGGNAFMTDAMINDVSASKLTAGTIDASKITVINIDANNITANAATFFRTQWVNNYGNRVAINPNDISIYSNTGSNLTINANQMHFTDTLGQNYSVNDFAYWNDINNNLTTAVGLYIGLRGGDNSFLSFVDSNGLTAGMYAGGHMDRGANTNIFPASWNFFMVLNLAQGAYFESDTRYHIYADLQHSSLNIYAADHVYFNHPIVQASLLSKKIVLGDYGKSALDEINKTDIKRILYKDNQQGQVSLTPIIDDVNAEKKYYIPDMIAGHDGADLYSMISMGWLGLKEEDAKAELLKQEIIELKARVAALEAA